MEEIEKFRSYLLPWTMGIDMMKSKILKAGDFIIVPSALATTLASEEVVGMLSVEA